MHGQTQKLSLGGSYFKLLRLYNLPVWRSDPFDETDSEVDGGVGTPIFHVNDDLLRAGVGSRKGPE